MWLRILTHWQAEYSGTITLGSATVGWRNLDFAPFNKKRDWFEWDGDEVPLAFAGWWLYREHRSE